MLQFATEPFVCAWNCFGIKCRSNLLGPKSTNCPHPKSWGQVSLKNIACQKRGFASSSCGSQPPSGLQPLAEWGSLQGTKLCARPCIPNSLTQRCMLGNYSWPLNRVGFSCTDPLVHGYFPRVNTSGRQGLWLVESMDTEESWMEPWIRRADNKYMQINPPNVF